MIVLAAIALYFVVAIPAASLLGRRLRRQSTTAPRPQLERVDDRQLDIEIALGKASRR